MNNENEPGSAWTAAQVSPMSISDVVVTHSEARVLDGLSAHHSQLTDAYVHVTEPEVPDSKTSACFRSAQQVVNMVYPGDKAGLKLVDLGCLEGGYSAGFARLGFDVLGIEVRDYNYARCEALQRRAGLSNLRFVKDDVMNIDSYGEFDVGFCCGILYHLDRPVEFLAKLATSIKKLLIIETHFSLAEKTKSRFKLGDLVLHEGVEGRWYKEFESHTPESVRQHKRYAWSSLRNDASFWIRREQLLELLYHFGYQTVFEQFDGLAPNIAENLDLQYPDLLRGTFVAIRNDYPPTHLR